MQRDSHSASRSLSTLCHNGEVCRFASPGVELLMSMFSTVATDLIKDVARAGTMVEYERRISSGGLVDGDSFLLDTIQQLQRFYEELSENEEACSWIDTNLLKNLEGVDAYGLASLLSLLPMHR